VSEIFLVSALICVFWGVVSSINITVFLSRRGVKINFFLYRLLIFKYVHQYSQITTEENGKPGFWFYSYVVSMNLALVLAIVGALFK
jgi:hypothetical protein